MATRKTVRKKERVKKRAGAKQARPRSAVKKPARTSRIASAARPAAKRPPAMRQATAPASAAASRSPAVKKADSRSAAARRAEAVRRQLDRARIGTFQELFASSSPEVQSIAAKLRELVYEVIPDVSETVYLGWKIALYKKRSEICGIQPAGDRCNLYLTRGVLLLDPQGLLEGSGKRLRHVKVRSVVGITAQGIRELLRQAVELPVS